MNNVKHVLYRYVNTLIVSLRVVGKTKRVQEVEEGHQEILQSLFWSMSIMLPHNHSCLKRTEYHSISLLHCSPAHLLHSPKSTC